MRRKALSEQALGLAVCQAVELAAVAAVAAGRAEVRVSEPEGEEPFTVELEPVDDAAAPLSVWVEYDSLVGWAAGRGEMHGEFFSHDAAEIVRAVRGLSESVVAGRYSEKVKGGARASIRATWEREGRLEEARYGTLFVVRSPGERWQGWETVSYESY